MAMRGGAPVPTQQRERLFRGLQACLALIMAHQLAGKAARDGYFLTYFHPSRLPEMVAVAAALSLAASYLCGRLFAHRSPAAVLPAAFFLSGVLQAAEWLLLLVHPQSAAVLIYLHMFVLGPLLFSGFWATISEEVDPREAKRRTGRIAAWGTVGGLAGGLLGERIVRWFGPESLMVVLSVTHIACAVLLFVFLKRREPSRERRTPAEGPPPETSGDLERRYLITLGALILLAAICGSLLDLAFKFSASAAVSKGADLVGFFAMFYAGVALLTLLLQSLVSRVSLEKMGLGRTMSVLPATVLGGGMAALLLDGAGLVSAVRGAEAALRHSLFRTGCEVCFTPLSAARKRRAKPVIDVGAERLGDLVGSLMARFILGVAPGRTSTWLLLAASTLAAVALFVARAVDKGYVRTLAGSLVRRGAELGLLGPPDLTMRTVVSDSGICLGYDSLPSWALPPSAPAETQQDPVLVQLAGLRSRDQRTVWAALQSADAGDPLIAVQLARLLGSQEFGAEALSRLRPVAGRHVGFLCDFLADADQDVQARRRAATLLAGVPEQRSVDGLIAGLSDERFEVRFQCSRGLLKLKRSGAELRFDSEPVLAAVDRELSTGLIIQEGKQLTERGADALQTEWLDGFLKERAHAGLEYVFTLLALEFPEEPLLVAFRALHLDDERLRGTALEFLESVLPATTKQLLWGLVGERPAHQEPRDATDVLSDLMKASATVNIRLKIPISDLKNRNSDV